MDQAKGWKHVKQILKDRFGNDFIISESWLEKVTNGPIIKPSDQNGLQDYADNLHSCTETLSAIGKLRELTLERIFPK